MMPLLDYSPSPNCTHRNESTKYKYEKKEKIHTKII